MKKRFFHTILSGVFLSLVVFIAQGCHLYEKYDECPSNVYIIIKAYATGTNGEQELDENTVGEVELFVFDRNEKYLGNITTELNKNTYLNFKGHRNLIVVALGNSAGIGQTVIPSDRFPTSEISLQTLTKAAAEFGSPDDLFHGKVSFEVSPKYEEHKIELPIVRKIGEMNVTIRGLSKQAADTDSDYQIVVHETCATMDFSGNLIETGAKASYKPLGTFFSNGDYFIDDFNLFPCNSGEKLAIDILYKGTPIVTGIDKDSSGNHIMVGANDKVNILIELNTGPGVVEVTVVAATWGSRIHIWSEK